MSTESLVEVYRAANGPQAYLVANFLNAARIPAIAEGDALQWSLGDLPLGWATSPRVLVHERDAAAARALIDAAEAADDGPLPGSELEDVESASDTDRNPES